MNISPTELVLEVSNISKRFGDHLVLDEVSLSLSEGEVVSLLGISGSGKTTLFNLISGLLIPDEGSIKLRGEDITGQQGKVAYMLQKDLLLKHMSILDNVALPLFIKGVNKNKSTRTSKYPITGK